MLQSVIVTFCGQQYNLVLYIRLPEAISKALDTKHLTELCRQEIKGLCSLEGKAAVCGVWKFAGCRGLALQEEEHDELILRFLKCI